MEVENEVDYYNEIILISPPHVPCSDAMDLSCKLEL